jgi:hypothetical protein
MEKKKKRKKRKKEKKKNEDNHGSLYKASRQTRWPGVGRERGPATRRSQNVSC